MMGMPAFAACLTVCSCRFKVLVELPYGRMAQVPADIECNY